MVTRLTGDYIEIFTVSNLNMTDENETKVGETKGDVVLPTDVTEASVNPHNKKRPVTKPVRFDDAINFEGTITSILQALTDLGILDSNNVLQGFNPTMIEAIRLKVYENKDDTTPSQEWDAEDVYIKRGDITFPTEDFADWTADGTVNGPITKTA
jgi:hypothetical protein